MKTTMMKMTMMILRGWEPVLTSPYSPLLKPVPRQRVRRLPRSHRVESVEAAMRGRRLLAHAGTRLPPPLRARPICPYIRPKPLVLAIMSRPPRRGS